MSVRAFRGSQQGPAIATSFSTPSIPRPAVVSGLHVASITTTSSSLSWTADATVGDGAVDEYDVTVTPTGSTTVVASSTTTLPLSGLTPGAAYTATVRAHNESGWSDPVSATFTTNDLDRRTPGAPTLTVGAPDVSGNVHASWVANAGDSTDFPVRNWVVTVDGADSAFLPASTLQYTVTSLGTGRHTVSVRGVNDMGSNAFAARVVVIPSSSPAPPVLSSSMTATLSTVNYGATSRLAGAFLSGSTPVSDSVVTLWSGAGSTWRNVATTLTGGDGTFAFTVKPSTTTQYRAIASGMPSAYATVSVRPKVAIKASYAKSRGKTVIHLAVGVAPRLSGALVRLQRLVGTRWVSVTAKRLDSKSRAVFTIGSFAKKYVARYRITMAATSYSAVSTSSSVVVVAPHR